MEPLRVEVIRSCSSPISVARLGWYPRPGMRQGANLGSRLGEAEYCR